MRSLHIDEVPEAEVRRTFRYSRWPPLFALLMLLAIPAFLTYGLIAAFDWPWWGWMIAGILALLPALIWQAVFSSMWHIFAAGFKPTNWVMKTTPEGIYLQIRSYHNHHFPRDIPSVTYLPFEEIVSANKTMKRVKTFYRKDGRSRVRFLREKYLYLHVDEDVETGPLRQAVAEERVREAPTVGYTQTKFRSDHVPVQVPKPGVIQVDWRGGDMLEELQFHLRITRLRRLGWGHHEPGEEPTIDEQVVAMLEQGRSMDAATLLEYEYGVSLTDAERMVEELNKDLARNPPPDLSR